MKKIIKTLLVVMVLAVVLTAFTGCDAETLKGLVPPALTELVPPHVTCAVFGHKGAEHTPCERCGVVWIDNETNLDCTLNGHTMVSVSQVLPTCTEDGMTAGLVCSVCGHEDAPRKVIPATGHKMIPATCEVAEYCIYCRMVGAPALGHTPVDVEAVEPTCVTAGCTAGTACDVCDKVLSGCEVIPADPTAHGKAVEIEALAPTCSTPGHTAGTGCVYCGTPYTGCEKIDIDPDAHYFVSGLCAICQKVFEHGVGDNTRVALDTLGVADDGSLYEFIYFYIPVAGHYKLAGENILVTVFTADGSLTLLAIGEGWLEAGVYVVGLNYYAGAGEYTFNVSTVDCTNTEEVTKAPTCTETGLKTTTCTVCGHVVEGVEVPVVDHEYTDGYCSCGAVDPDYYFTVTIPEALEKADGSKVIVSGTVVEIYQAYNSQYNNTSVYVADAEGNKILLFRVPGNWSIGDKLTVKGEIDIYNQKAQVAQGSTVVEYTDVTRVYLSNAAGWTNAYCYNGDANWTTEAAWPGKAMTYDAELKLWYYDVPAANVNVIFNNGNGAQSADLTLPTNDKIVYDNKAAYWGVIGEKFDYSDKYTVAGSSGLCGSEWAPADTANDMTYDEATETYTKVYTNVKAGTYEFKCVKDHSWNVAYPGSNKSVTVAKDGSTVVITLKDTVVSVEVKEPVANALVNASLSFASKDQRTSYSTSQQVWEQNGVKLTNDKASSTSNVGDYANPARFYQNSKVTIEGAGMTKVVLTRADKATAAQIQGYIQSANANATVTINGNDITVVFDEPVDSFSFVCGSQVRLSKIVVNP